MTDDKLELTRRKILAGVGAAGLAGAGAGLGTSAFFSDEETFTNNQLVAGELDLKVGWQEHYSNWMDDDYSPYPGAETTYAEMPDQGETPDLFLPPAPGQTDASPIELVFTDPPGDDGGTDSRPAEDDGGRQFLRNTKRQEVNGGYYGGPADLCAAEADVPEDRALIEVEDLKPGDFGFALFRLRLCDNPGYLWLDGGLVDASENGTTEPEAEDPDERDGVVELLDAVQVAYDVGTTNDIADPDSDANPLPQFTNGTLQNQTSLRNFLTMLGTGIPLEGDIDAEEGGGTGRECFSGETDHFASVVWWLPIDHGNQVQSDSATFDLGFYTEQCRHNDGVGLSTGLAGYYPLDTVWDGTAEDLSGNGNDGTVVGDVSSVDGKVGKAASFDGSGDYVEISDDPSLGVTNVTLSAWIYRNGSKNLVYVVDGRDHNYFIKFDDGTSTPRFGVMVNGSFSIMNANSGDIPDQTWTHVAGTYDGSEMNIYVNGNNEGTQSVSGDIDVSSGPARIGNYIGGGYDYPGLIDDLRIYGRALSESEVQSLSTL